MHECELNRFETVHLAPVFVEERGRRNLVEVYDLLHLLPGYGRFPATANRPPPFAPS
ncbi:hypothetical protein [Nonomuraea sp. NPDC050691]|uniref:hypothetical protein n=1 Tax=Nonomuraea sp. NPDC050691 TaxID=3155661 RepID=UPI0033D4F84B